MTLEPCPNPPDEHGFCGNNDSIYKKTGKFCEAKSPTIHHQRAAEICQLKQEMLKK
jgi:hypothetical protein